MKDKIIFLGIAIMLIAVGVRAAELSGDFSLEAKCGEVTPTIYVLSNNTSSTQTYTISAIGENADWINLNGKWIASDPLEITIKKNSSKELHAIISTQDCYVEPGKYTLTVKVDGQETEIEIEVISTSKLELEVSPTDASITQCESQEFTAEVENTGETDAYAEISVSGIPSAWVSIREPEFLLEKGAKREFLFTVEPACDAQVIQYKFDVVAAIRKTSFKATEEIVIDLEDAQKIAITATDFKACIDSAKSGTIEVKNNGLLEDELALSITGAGFASLEETSVSLEAGESASITVNFEEGANAGTYPVTVKAKSTKFNKESAENFEVEVKDCYNVSVGNVASSFDGEAACLEENPKYVFTLENDSENEITVKASIKGIEATVEPAEITISAGQKAVVGAEIDLAAETAGEKEFTLLLESDHFTAEEKFTLKVEDCYAIEVDYGALLEPIDKNADCAPEPITVTVTNTGSKQNSVKAELTGPKWVTMQPIAASLESGEETGFFVYITPPYNVKEGKHSAKLTFQTEDFKGSQEIEINVYGGLYADLGKASVSANSSLENLLEEVDRTVEVKLSITNDSNALLRVEDINVQGFYAEDTFTEAVLQPNETVETTVKLYLGKGWELEEFPVTVHFLTNKGIVEREITVDLNPKEKEEVQIATVGLFGLANARNAVLVAIVAIVIALAVVAGLRLSRPKPSATLSSLADQVHAEPGKKLEQIGKKKVRKRAKKK